MHLVGGREGGRQLGRALAGGLLQLMSASPGLLIDIGGPGPESPTPWPGGMAAGWNQGLLEGCGSLAQVATLLPTITAPVNTLAQGEQT